MNTILSELAAAAVPAIVAIIGTVLTVVMQRAAVVANERWGIEIEARHREALHSAIMSGIQSALSRGLTGRAVIGAALEHASGSVPDAIRKLAPGPGILQSIAEAKLREVTANFVDIDPRIHAPGAGALVMATIEDAIQSESKAGKGVPR